ncbi:mechanosensitive ion channel family protein [Uliginosibacterium sp. H3]|uniref:Small-conductance mechanosensitive channel n=1 Tax=Uliginosibacterium silvisoli TaxID=3114758 RepID=A0ABU6K915_9RHOO|nr:mechanosensitive ion channel family protein [Uliginosibacterium sp. H3]
MLTLLLVSLSAILWLLQFTVGQETGILSAGIARALFIAAWGFTAISAVQVLQYVFSSWLIGQRRTHVASDLLRAVVRILLYLLAGGFFLHFILGQEITGLLATSAMLSVIIGLALQPTLGHLFSGVSIEIERPLHVGDYIRRGDLEGQVISLNWRSVFIRTERGSRVILPNSDFTSHTVEVISGDQPYRHSAFFDLATSEPPGKIMRIAMRVLRSELPHVCRTPEPSVVMLGTEPRSGSVHYAAHFYTMNFLERNHVASAVLERLWYALSREGLQLMPPQRFGNNSNNVKTQPRSETVASPVQAQAGNVASSTPAPAVHPNPAWRTLLGDLLPDLSPGLVDRLGATAKRYRYGQYETISTKVAAVVLSGRVREQYPAGDAAATAALQRVLQFGPESVHLESCLPRHKLEQLISDAAQIIGPLGQSLATGYAAVTDDLWLAYHAIAAGISNPEQREAFLARGPAQASRGLTAGGVLGWANVFELLPSAIPGHATQDCELLVWNASTLRKLLQAASEADRQSLLVCLQRLHSACDKLDMQTIDSWITRPQS